MNLFESIKLLVGKAGPGGLHTPGPATGSECPHEADVLAFSEGRLSHRRREQLESHFLFCDDCRAFLALFARSSDDATEPDIQPLTDKAIKNQTARVLTYIKEDDFNRRKAEGNKQPVEAMGGGLFAFNRQGAATRLFSSTRQLVSIGLVICAVMVGTIYFVTENEPKNVMTAREALTLAVKDKRVIEPRLTGLPYSRYPAGMRSDKVDEDLQSNHQFGRAQAAIQFAEDVSAPAESRMLLAKVYLARGNADNASRALTILEQLSAGGNQSPELLNDLGVALYQLGRYSEASSYFNKALDKSPGFNEALFNKAVTEEKLSSRAKAREDWNRFIESTSDERWKEEARRHLE
jgi:tetratricopeptide (TPR) repeat protein